MMKTRQQLSFLLFSLLAPMVYSQPVVDLGSDTSLCASTYLLDAGNPGATFLWSTGASSQTINADSSGTYWVQVTGLSGTGSDTIILTLADVPTQPMVADTTFCQIPEIQLTADVQATYTIWERISSPAVALGLGDTLNYQPIDIDTLTVFTMNPLGLQKTGYPDPASAPTGIYANIPQSRGIRLNVLQASTLFSVDVYAEAGATGTITFSSSSGVPLFSTTDTFENQGLNRVFLDYPLTPGNNYHLTLENKTGNFYRISSSPFNFQADLIEVTRGQPVSSQYSVFFNLQAGIGACPSAIDTTIVTPLPVPDLALGTDTLICGSSFTIDVSGTNASSFLWSDGSSLPTFTADSSRIYWCEATLGTCSFRDSIEFEFNAPPPALLPFDSTVCGSQEVEFIVSNESEITLWYDLPVGGSIQSQDTSFSQYYQDTSSVWVQRINPSRPDSVSYPDLSSAPAGNYFGFNSSKGLIFSLDRDKILISVDIYALPVNAGNPIPRTGDIIIRDELGTPLLTQSVSLPVAGKNTVILNLAMSEGNDYSIVLENAEGQFYVVPSGNYPFVESGVRITSGTPISAQYSYFYNFIWNDTYCATSLAPYQVNVKFPKVEEDSIYSCAPLSLSGPTGAIAYLWSTGETSSSIVVDTTGLISVTADDSAGCNVTYTIDFETPNPVFLGDDGDFCGNILSSGYEAPAIITWSTTDTTPSITVTSPGLYWVEVQEPKGCVLTDSITISSFNPLPEIDLGQDTAVCISLMLSPGPDSLSYHWSTGDTTTTLTISSSGLYSVIATDKIGCTSFDSIGVSVTQIPNANFGFDTTGLSVSFFNTSGFGSYLWDFGDNSSSTQINPVHTYAQSGEYEVFLIASNECGSDTISFFVTVKDPSVSIDQVIPFVWNVFQEDGHIHWSLSRLDATTPTYLNLRGINGTIIQTQTLGASLNQGEGSFSSEGLSAGVYILSITQGRSTTFHKILIQ